MIIEPNICAPVLIKLLDLLNLLQKREKKKCLQFIISLQLVWQIKYYMSINDVRSSMYMQ